MNHKKCTCNQEGLTAEDIRTKVHYLNQQVFCLDTIGVKKPYDQISKKEKRRIELLSYTPCNCKN